MPISTNAPFNEFGQSQILRDIEQLYLAMNAAGTGGAGDGQTQDQSSSNPIVPETEPIDLSQYATLDDLNNIPQVTYPISIANGGTGKTTAAAALGSLLGLSIGARRSILTGSGNYTVPAGVYTITVVVVGGGGGRPTTTTVSGNNVYVAATSGGAVTTAFQLNASGGGGGAGGCAVGFLHVTPGQTIAYSVGAAGGTASSGGSSTFGAITAYGGAGAGSPTQSGAAVIQGQGGAGGYSDLSTVHGFGIPGSSGTDGVITNFSAVVGQGGLGTYIGGNFYGSGGYSAISAVAGTIAVFY